MKIVVDAMGGDNAPSEIVLGAVAASREMKDIQLCLVGDEKAIFPLLKATRQTSKIEIVHCTDAIRMDEHPGPGLRSRRQASMVVAATMVKKGEAQAMVCAGNTGALHQVSLLEIGRIKGVRRPALAAVFPTNISPSLALDVGANADGKTEYLIQFALMGSIYSQKVMGREKPKVALLNIGKEEGKGSSNVVAAYEQLRRLNIVNFVGNVEPMAFFEGEVDVAVCDGFVGNMMLKTSESVAEWLMQRIRLAARRTPASKLGGHLLKPSLKGLIKDISHSEHGGAVLLGLKGLVIKCHGRATADTIANGIKVAARGVRNQVVSIIEDSLSAEEANEPEPATA